jgi:hypothetical protein
MIQASEVVTREREAQCNGRFAIVGMKQEATTIKHPSSEPSNPGRHTSKKRSFGFFLFKMRASNSSSFCCSLDDLDNEDSLQPAPHSPAKMLCDDLGSIYSLFALAVRSIKKGKAVAFHCLQGNSTDAISIF